MATATTNTNASDSLPGLERSSGSLAPSMADSIDESTFVRSKKEEDEQQNNSQDEEDDDTYHGMELDFDDASTIATTFTCLQHQYQQQKQVKLEGILDQMGISRDADDDEKTKAWEKLSKDELLELLAALRVDLGGEKGGDANNGNGINPQQQAQSLVASPFTMPQWSSPQTQANTMANARPAKISEDEREFDMDVDETDYSVKLPPWSATKKEPSERSRKSITSKVSNSSLGISTASQGSASVEVGPNTARWFNDAASTDHSKVEEIPEEDTPSTAMNTVEVDDDYYSVKLPPWLNPEEHARKVEEAKAAAAAAAGVSSPRPTPNMVVQDQQQQKVVPVVSPPPPAAPQPKQQRPVIQVVPSQKSTSTHSTGSSSNPVSVQKSTSTHSSRHYPAAPPQQQEQQIKRHSTSTHGSRRSAASSTGHGAPLAPKKVVSFPAAATQSSPRPSITGSKKPPSLRNLFGVRSSKKKLSKTTAHVEIPKVPKNVQQMIQSTPTRREGAFLTMEGDNSAQSRLAMINANWNSHYTKNKNKGASSRGSRKRPSTRKRSIMVDSSDRSERSTTSSTVRSSTNSTSPSVQSGGRTNSKNSGGGSTTNNSGHSRSVRSTSSRSTVVDC